VIKVDFYFLFSGEIFYLIKIKNRVANCWSPLKNSYANLPSCSHKRSFYFGKWLQAIADRIETVDRVWALVWPSVELSQYSRDAAVVVIHANRNENENEYKNENRRCRITTSRRLEHVRMCARTRTTSRIVTVSWPALRPADSLPGVSHSTSEVDFC